ncbi:Fic family protein [Pseudomonas sp. LBUM920]|nr:Fic family protein [Pseudomonas sp. LBUM920]
MHAGVTGGVKDSGRRSARAGYCNALESSQKATLGITDWLEWFLKTLLLSLEQAMARID